MPPERINTTSIKKYLKEPDLYSDVYQIGLLMYLVLYNTLPFDGFIWEELATNIKEANAVFADVSFLNVPVPEKLILILQKCLQKIPYERYKDAAEILADFKKLVF
jgi:serine/threonine protein kinase